MTASWRLRRVRAEDAAAIAAIYRYYVDRTPITFELEAPTAEEIGRRIASLEGRFPYLVATAADGALIGYAYAASFRERAAYRFAVETTVYLAPDAQGGGIGQALYTRLLDILTAQGFVHAIGAVTLPNARSVALHERVGFVACGTYPDIGYKLDRWETVGLFYRQLRQLPETPEEPVAPSDCAAWRAIDP